MNATRIPAGITDLHMEIYISNGKIEYIKGGSRHPFEDLDQLSLTVIRQEMDKNTDLDAIFRMMEIYDPVEQIKKWLACNFGDFDRRADITDQGIIIKEYWDCGQRGSCPYEGKFCSLPGGAGGQLTPREIEVVRLVAQDLADKEIADRMNISINTVAIHRTHIEHKIGAHSKVGIAVFAVEHHIL
jgi:DNA-binding CsgD family transcriptional regulator